MAQPIKLAFWRKDARPHVTFETWLEATMKQLEESRGVVKLEDFGTWSGKTRNRSQGQNGPELAQAYRKHARSYLQECGAIAFNIVVEEDNQPLWRLEELPKDKIYPVVDVRDGRFHSANSLEIGTLRVRHANLELSNCRIGNLILDTGSIRLVLKDCWVGRLEIQNDVVLGDCSISGGGVLSFETPKPATKLFRGYLEIDRQTYVPTGPTSRMPTPNAYLFLRHQLTEVGNTEAAGFFARAEHYFNYRREPGAARLVSFLYWATSDYGTSVTRPLLWTLGLVATGTAFGFTVGPVLDPDFLKHANDSAMADQLHMTWYSAFLDDDWRARLARATAAAWGAVFNPFSVFGDRGVVLMPSWWSNLILKLIGAFTTLSIAMFFLAIRRRFRLS